MFNVSEKNVREWRKRKEELLETPAQKRAKRGKRPRWPEMEKKLKEWILMMRRRHLRVNTPLIRLQAQQLAQTMNIVGFADSKKQNKFNYNILFIFCTK